MLLHSVNTSFQESSPLPVLCIRKKKINISEISFEIRSHHPTHSLKISKNLSQILYIFLILMLDVIPFSTFCRHSFIRIAHNKSVGKIPFCIIQYTRRTLGRHEGEIIIKTSELFLCVFFFCFYFNTLMYLFSISKNYKVKYYKARYRCLPTDIVYTFQKHFCCCYYI